MQFFLHQVSDGSIPRYGEDASFSAGNEKVMIKQDNTVQEIRTLRQNLRKTVSP